MAPQRHRHPARQPEPPHARRVRRHASSPRRTSTASPQRALRFDAPLRRLAAVHAGAPRHPVRRARLPLEAVGLDRALGGADHRAICARAGVDDDADHRPPAPVRDRRRELPHATSPPGTTSAGHESDPWKTRPDPSWMGAPTFEPRPHALRQLARLLPRRGRLPRPAHDGGGGALARRRTPAATTASCSSSTSSIRTSRSTRPSPTRRCTTTTWEGPHLIWPPYVRGALAARRARRAAGAAGARLLRRAS